MEILNTFLGIDNTFFKVFGYQMSYIEFSGTTLGLASVWLATKANIHTWTTGILNVIAFFIIYYQIQLYSDMFLQIFFLGSSILGLWQWYKKKLVKNDKIITSLNQNYLIYIIMSIIIFSILLGFFMSRIHIYYPDFFKKPTSYPYTDALISILSIYATFIMAYKKVECWILWILVDIISSILYFQKGVLFISLEYFLFLIMAIIGLFQWIKSIKYAQGFSTR
jgi:nicotinamide mononucleotide transporter